MQWGCNGRDNGAVVIAVARDYSVVVDVVTVCMYFRRGCTLLGMLWRGLVCVPEGCV